MSVAMSKIFSILAIKSLMGYLSTSNALVAQQSMSGGYQGQYRLGDDCAEKAIRENRIIEGVNIAPVNPLEKQIEDMEKKQRCAMLKRKAEESFNNKYKRLMQETANETKKQIDQTEEKKKCVSKLDKANHECFVKNVLNDFYTAVVWKVAVHDNVAQLWYQGKLAMMLVYEPIGYKVNQEEKECFTFFPTSNVAAEENALGHVVNIVGKPATPSNKTASECRPCTDFLKDNKTLEGKGMKCANTCDPSNLLFTNSNFKTNKKSEPSDKKSTTSSKAKEE